MHVDILCKDGVYCITPKTFADDRGYFSEIFTNTSFVEKGLPSVVMVQSNWSVSQPGVIRGLHAQFKTAKLVYCIAGEILDVAVDMRPGSPTYLNHWTARLSAENRKGLYIGEGFAHGFAVLGTKPAHVVYQQTREYSEDETYEFAWDDPAIGIMWPLNHPILSDKDKNHRWVYKK